MTDLVFSLDAVTAARPGSADGFRDLSWAVREGEVWAVVGPTGSGKSTLADLLMGRIPVRAGEVRWPLLDRLRAAGRAVGFASEVIARVAFKEESRRFSYARHYYQERFHFTDPHDDITLDAFLRGGLSVSDDAVRAAATRVGVDRLRGLSFLKLSNGQTRRARLARGLLTDPELLVLDDPFMGLDAAGRADVAALLGDLVHTGHRLLLITRPDAVPEWVTNVLELDQFAAVWQGPAASYSLPPGGGGLGWGVTTPTVPAVANGGSVPPPPQPSPTKGEGAGEETAPVIQLRDVNVAYGGTPILSDVNWTVRAGERWAVVGPNGSGKSTLLSLLCGDHPQAYANDVRLFGRRRGSGESVWDVKRPVGLVSPELHLYFSEPLTAFQTAATGFADGVVYHPATREQSNAVRELFDQFGLGGVADRPFARLSTGEQREVLLVRALVKRPPLLILDEPFQGFDAAAVARARDWLDAHLRPDQTLLFVTHYADEIPRSVTHRLRLDGGRVAEQA